MSKLLPERAHMGHLKDQARDLVQAHRRGEPEAVIRVREFLPRLGKAADAEILAASLPLHDALWIVAREYGFASWPRLKAALEVRAESVQAMRQAIDDNDAGRVRALLAAEPGLADQYLQRGNGALWNQRPLTYAAQRVRPEIVRVLLDAGADPFTDGNLAIARAAMYDTQLPILEMFLERGMDANCQVYNWGPLMTYPAECQAPQVLKWLLAHGADPNLRLPHTRCTMSGWEVLISDYDRTPRFHECVNVMLAGGADHDGGPAIDLFRGDFQGFARRLASDPELAHRRFDLHGANLPLEGCTLLHLCAEWNFVEAAEALLRHGADVNSPAPIQDDGLGGHTPIFRTVNSIHQWNFPMLGLLLNHGADLDVRVSVEWVGRVYRDVTPLSYASLARRVDAEYERVAALLIEHGAME